MTWPARSSAREKDGAQVTGSLPLSSTQERIRFEEQIRRGSTAYHMSEIFRVSGWLDTAALQEAVDTLVSRHAALRTVFTDLADEAGTPTQRVLPPGAVRVEIAMTATDPGAAREAAVSEAKRPFDLARGPLLRVLVIRTGRAEQLLVLTLHHLICDGWSLSILHQELGAAYAASRVGVKPDLPPLSRQFPDAVRAERDRLDARAADQLVGWWRGYLGDAPTALDLPADHRRTAGAARRSARCGLLLDPTRSDAVRALARRHEATLFMTLLSALGVVIARQTGQERLLVGSPVSTRRAADRGVIGCFLNTLPLCLDVGGNPPFGEFLGRVRRSVLDALAHQDVPFHRLVGGRSAAREPNRAALVQVFFNVVPPSRELDLADCATELQAFPEIDAKFDLSLYVADHGDQLALDAVYDAALYRGERVADLLGQLALALDQAAAEPGQRVRAFCLATSQAAQLTRSARPELPALASAPLQRESLLERLAGHARRRPGHPALVGPAGTWSYQDLAGRVEVLAERLAARGIGRGDVLAVRAARDPAVVVAVLAAMRINAVFALLDADYPADELRARATLLKPTAWIDAAPGHPAEPLTPQALDTGENGPAGAPPALPAFCPPSPDDDAYVAFTSGTTGKPRQIVGTHGPLTHFLSWYARAFSVTPADRFSVLSGIGHDPFLRDVLAPLWAGATAVFPDADVRDSAALADGLREQKITVTHLTPALADALSSAPTPGWPALRLVGFGGDVLTRRTLGEWAELAPSADLLNLYGATETPQAVSVHVARRAGQRMPADTDRVPLGPGIDEVQLLVLAGDKPAAIGELGEIVVRTRHLARYADSPSGRRAGEYRTGDLGRLRPDGLVDFAGRADRQVKVRGYRVEPAEVEAVLAGWPGVRQSAVLASPQERCGHRLVACLAVGAGSRPDLAGLRAALSARLASYKVPAAFTVVDAFPLTSNGKIDNAALLLLGQQTTVAPHVAPGTALEQQLARIWGEVLGRERIGAHDDFFALGGHSLLLGRVRVRIRQELGADVTLRELFEHPTVAGLAVLVGQSGQAAPQRPVPRGAESESAPLSLTQQRIWLEDQLRPGDTAYNMPLVLRLRGPLDDAALQSAVNAVVRRHAVLRSRIFVRGGEPVQQPRVDTTVTIRHLDLTAAPEASDAEAMREAKQPFDLSDGPLLRVLLVRVAPDEHLLVLTVHHIAFDGWSFSVLLDAISHCYRAALRGAPADLGEGLNFADVARWQRAEQDDTAMDRSAAWWRERLAAWPVVLELPTDRSRPPVQAHRGARRRLEIDPETAEQLRRLARSHHTTLFMILLSAFGAVLSRWAGQERLLVGTPVASRDRAEFEDMIGCFIDTVPVALDLRGDPRFEELLGRVTNSALGAFAHQAVPFGRLVSDLAQRDLSRSPLIQVLFALQNVPMSAFEAPGVSCELVRIGEANVQFDLTLRMLDIDGAITGWLDYDTALFDAETAGRLLDHLIRLIRDVTADPTVRVTAVDLVGSAERHALLHEWNATAMPRPPGRTLTTLLEEQALRSPQGVAVRCGGMQLTYAELHRRAGYLAQRLRELGVGPDTLVGVHLERSAELMIALLAVLKAGGAYLPLDPGYPGDRLAFMISDAGVPVVLTGPGSDIRQLANGSVTVLDVTAEASTRRHRTGQPAAGPEHLAYVIYTSGSTGAPKGVQVPHQGIVNRLLWMQETYRLRADDAVLQKTPISFDVSVWELFWPLLAGAQLVLADPGGHRDPRYLAQFIQEERVTVCHFVPPMLRAFLDTARADSCASLRLVVCSGEALSADLARRFHRTLPAAALENLYGPTEASVDVTRWSCQADWDRRTVPIGRPIANTRGYVLDRRMAPLPVGVPGELYLGGVQLARAYAGRPELTADRFVPDPFSAPGARLYRTGDLARWRPDGVLEYLGRTDRQVKVRGFRIEPGEIEAALTDQPGVGQAVVTVREDQPGERRIVAYLTAEPATGPGAQPALPPPAALRAGLARTLPDHMIPSAFVTVPAMPLSPNGKVDGSALPTPPDGSADPATDHIAPRTSAERQVAALWQEVLRRDHVGVTENFFELGGDSMHAVRVIGLARERGLDLTLTQLFTHQTVEAVAACLAVRAEPAEPRARSSELAAFGLLSPTDLARLQAK